MYSQVSTVFSKLEKPDGKAPRGKGPLQTILRPSTAAVLLLPRAFYDGLENHL